MGLSKKPREAAWIVGVVLLLVTMAYGLTGYLLPWDNRAYWGTVITTRIAGQGAAAGSVCDAPSRRRWRSGCGDLRLFYGLHVLLLPPATILLIALHVFLVRKHRVAVPGDEFVPSKKCYRAEPSRM